MASPIAPIAPVAPIDIASPARAGATQGAGSFGSLLGDSIARVEGLRASSGEAIGRMLSGEGEEIHQVALQVQQAEIAFELFLQVRNKVAQAYQEVMRMQM